MSKPWNTNNDWMKPNQRDHFSEGIAFSRWAEAVKSEEIYKEQQERKNNEKPRDNKRDTEDGERG